MAHDFHVLISKKRNNFAKIASIGSVIIFMSFILLMTFNQSSPITSLHETTIVNGQPPYKASYHTDTSSRNITNVIRTGDNHQRVLSNSQATRTEEQRARDAQASDQGTSPGDANEANTPGDEKEEKYLSTAHAAAADLNYTISYQLGGDTNFSRIFSYDDRGNRQLLDDKWTQMPGATKELVLSAPELFDKIPLHFLESFKNPCWLRGETELNCLPYFYIIGMFKCGTTDIYDKIVAHPDVVKVPKEPHWWGPRRHGFIGTPAQKKQVLQARNITGQADDRSLEFYLNLYKFTGMQKLIDGKITDESGRIYHPRVFGDASISTAYALGLEWTQQYPNASEPLFTNADLLHALQPDAKIVLMIRNPTERANSWYWYARRESSAKKWDKLANRYINCFKKCLQSHNLRYCAYASGCPYSLIPNLQVGIYHVFLRDWINAYSRDRVHVIRLEDWKADPAKIYRELLKFLDLRPLTAQEEDRVLGRKVMNVNRRNHEDEWPQTVQALREFYKPYNEELARVLGGDEYLYT